MYELLVSRNPKFYPVSLNNLTVSHLQYICIFRFDIDHSIQIQFLNLQNSFCVDYDGYHQ